MKKRVYTPEELHEKMKAHGYDIPVPKIRIWAFIARSNLSSWVNNVDARLRSNLEIVQPPNWIQKYKVKKK